MSSAGRAKNLEDVARQIYKMKEDGELCMVERLFPTQVKTIVSALNFISASVEAQQEPLSPPEALSFLQELASDDVILKILDLLDALTLRSTYITCSRFHRLTRRAVQNRIRGTLYSSLFSPSQLLYVKDRLDSTGLYMYNSAAPLLFTGLPRWIRISGAGVVEINGVYHCTSCCAYGFEFGKIDDPAFESGALTFAIAKRFNGQQLIWYIGSRVMPRTRPAELEMAEGEQLFQYYAPLLSGVPDSGYPPTTEDLRRQNASWMPLIPAYSPAPTVSFAEEESFLPRTPRV